MFRYTPLTLLVPGQIASSVPADAAARIAYGDLAAGLLALLAVLLLRTGLPGAVPATWVFTVVGVGDILLAVRLGVANRICEHPLGFNWYLLNYYVPVLCVSHVMILSRLLRRRRASQVRPGPFPERARVGEKGALSPSRAPRRSGLE